MRLRCNRCGQFIGQNDKQAVAYTPYGTCLDTEPPDEEYICGKCWTEDMDDSDRALTRMVSWRKPQLLFQLLFTETEAT